MADGSHPLSQGIPASSRSSDEHARQIRESFLVRGHHHPTSSEPCRGDEQIVRTTGTSRAPYVSEQEGVSVGDLEVVGLHRDRSQDRLDIPLPRVPTSPVGQLDTDEKLCCGDRGNHDVILVGDQLIENLPPPFGSYQDRRIQDQAVQRRSSTAATARTSRSSFSHSRSRACLCRISLIDSPDALVAGPMRATGRPFLTMTKLSPRCSTASRISEKRRAASVAVIFTRIRLSD